ncbi:hypothetical protein H0G86_001968 [Trichoderma simmonsii]|uniref:Uncharacterized protein n=1 Tax=Trichoderma simmonsii TaxID=1491479 RepID=A0A8G0L7B1_9HYPO|nr:hypothetical protein H0G86_001968 [Trichoderma simmonsii]
MIPSVPLVVPNLGPKAEPRRALQALPFGSIRGCQSAPGWLHGTLQKPVSAQGYATMREEARRFLLGGQQNSDIVFILSIFQRKSGQVGESRSIHMECHGL